MSVSLKIRYFTDDYDWLCFKHAVELTNQGEEVHSTIEAYSETYEGSTVCNLCYKDDEDEEDKEWERIQRNEEEIIGYLRRIEERERQLRKSLEERSAVLRLTRPFSKARKVDPRILKQGEDAF